MGWVGPAIAGVGAIAGLLGRKKREKSVAKADEDARRKQWSLMEQDRLRRANLLIGVLRGTKFPGFDKIDDATIQQLLTPERPYPGYLPTQALGGSTLTFLRDLSRNFVPRPDMEGGGRGGPIVPASAARSGGTPYVPSSTGVGSTDVGSLDWYEKWLAEMGLS